MTETKSFCYIEINRYAIFITLLPLSCLVILLKKRNNVQPFFKYIVANTYILYLFP